MFKVRYAIDESGKRYEDRSPYSGEKFEDLYEKHIMNYNRELSLEVKWSHHTYAKLSENEHDPNKFISNYYSPKYSGVTLYKLDNDDVNALYEDKQIKLNEGICYTEVIPHDHLANVIITRDLIGDSDFEFGYVTCDKLTLDLKVTPNYEMFLNEYDELSLVSHLVVYDEFNHKFTISVPVGTFIVADIDKTDLKYSLTCYDYLYWSSVNPSIIEGAPEVNYRQREIYEDENGGKHVKKAYLYDVICKYSKNYNSLDNSYRTGVTTPFKSIGRMKDNDYDIPEAYRSQNIPVNVPVDYLEDDLQVRNFWGFVAGLTGKYIRADKTGITDGHYKTKRESSFINYSQTPKKYSASEFGEFIKKNYDMKITRLECTSVLATHNEDASGSEDNTNIDEILYYTEGTYKDVYSFSNPLMTEPELNNILTAYGYMGFTYTPISCKIIGDPRLDIGDIITLENRERPNKESLDTVIKSYKLPIMLQTINFKSGKSCIMTVESISDKYRRREVYTGLSIQDQLKKITDKVDSVENQVYPDKEEEDKTLVQRVEVLESSVGIKDDGSSENVPLKRKVDNLEEKIDLIEGEYSLIEKTVTSHTSDIKKLNEVVLLGYTETTFNGPDIHHDSLIKKIELHNERLNKIENEYLEEDDAENTYSKLGHTHSLSDIEGLEIPEIPDNTDLYERMNVVEQTLPNKSDVGHTHTVSEITDLQLPDNSELENRVTLLEEKIELLEQPEQPNEPDVDPGFGKKFILPSQCEGIIEKTSLDTDFILDEDFPIESPLYLKVIKASDSIILIEVTYLNEESIITTDKYSLIDGIYTLL